MSEYKDIELSQSIPELDEEQKLILFNMTKEELNQKFSQDKTDINPEGNWFYKISEEGILKYKLGRISKKIEETKDEDEIKKYKKEVEEIILEYKRKN